MKRLYTAEQFAQELGYPNVAAFEYARQDRHIPLPDGVYAKAPYWHEDTVKETVVSHLKAINAAFGRGTPKPGSNNPQSQ